MAQTSNLETIATLNTVPFKTAMKDVVSYTKNATENLNKTFEATKKIFTGLIVGRELVSIFKESYESLERLADSSKKLNISAASFQFLEFAAKRSGTEISEIEPVLQRLNLSLSRIGKNKEAGDALRLLGLNLKDLQNMPIDQSFFKIIGVLKELPNAARIDLGTQLFGKGFSKLAELSTQDIKKLKEAFQGLGGAVDISGDKLEGLKDKADDLAIVWERFKRIIATSFGGGMSDVLNGLIDVLGRVQRAIQTTSALARIAFPEGAFKLPGGSANSNGNLPFNTTTQMTAEDLGRAVLSPAFRRKSQGLPDLGQDASAQSIASKALLNYQGITNAAQGAIGTLKLLGNGFDYLTKAANHAANNLKEFRVQDFKDALGLGVADGKDYLNTILPPLEQYQSKDFNMLAKELRDQFATGTGAVDESSIGKLLANLGAIAETSYAYLRPGETNTGIMAAYTQLKNLREVYKNTGNDIPQQNIGVTLTYDQNGIIKAIVDSNTFSGIVVNTVASTAAREAQSTVASGG